MSINNINSDTYNKLISSITSNVARVVETSKVTTSISNKSSIDSLDLTSAIAQQSGYLNYNSDGKYSLPSLADLLDQYPKNNNSDDLFSFIDNSGNNSSDFTNYGDFLSNNTAKDNSVVNAFNEIASTKSKEIDDLISKALSKLSGSR